mmetsp:Transcript_11825/g.21387  ORF Transcript_11825/g.21387 Transcript_11825/m.21387 type:complete len:319 (-) Transcript_11825:380-1336(-)
MPALSLPSLPVSFQRSILLLALMLSFAAHCYSCSLFLRVPRASSVSAILSSAPASVSFLFSQQLSIQHTVSSLSSSLYSQLHHIPAHSNTQSQRTQAAQRLHSPQTHRNPSHAHPPASLAPSLRFCAAATDETQTSSFAEPFFRCSTFSFVPCRFQTTFLRLFHRFLALQPHESPRTRAFLHQRHAFRHSIESTAAAPRRFLRMLPFHLSFESSLIDAAHYAPQHLPLSRPFLDSSSFVQLQNAMLVISLNSLKPLRAFSVQTLLRFLLERPTLRIPSNTPISASNLRILPTRFRSVLHSLHGRPTDTIDIERCSALD